MKNYYFGWQLQMNNTQKSFSDALKRYYDKFGLPPHTILISDQLEEISIPAELQLVVKVHRVPKNILLIGDEDAQEM